MQIIKNFSTWFSKQNFLGKVFIGFSSLFILCCLCTVPFTALGSMLPTLTPTITFTPTLTSTIPFTSTLIPTIAFTPTLISTLTFTPTPTPTLTITLIPTITHAPTITRAPTITHVPTIIFVPLPTKGPTGGSNGSCDSSYPTVCIPPPPPDLDCKDIPYRRFKVLPPDPHHFDADHDGIGCES